MLRSKTGPCRPTRSMSRPPLPNSRRIIRTCLPVPEFVLNELSALCALDKAPDALVFGNGEHHVQRPKSSNGWFTRAVKAAKVQTITPHDLRHTCASLAVSAGVNVLALARMLGHKDPSVTLRVYAALFDTDLDAVAATLHASYGRGRTDEKSSANNP